MIVLRMLARWLLRRKHSNCLVYAFCRLIIEGGEVRITRHPIPGALLRAWWTPDGQILTRWAPRHPKDGFWRVLVHQIWFEGYPKEVKR